MCEQFAWYGELGGDLPHTPQRSSVEEDEAREPSDCPKPYRTRLKNDFILSTLTNGIKNNTNSYTRCEHAVNVERDVCTRYAL